MVSERMQRRIDALLDEADAAITASNWAVVAEKARAVLAIDEQNEDATGFLKMAEANGVSRHELPQANKPSLVPATTPAPVLPSSFAAGRYAVRRFLGEGGRKRVYLAHDSRLDREVAFCVIRAEGLDRAGHQRVLREAQSVARLGQHPNLVTVHDIGQDAGNPYIVQEYMAGGDVAGLIEKADDHRLPVERALAVAKDVCRGLSFIHAGGMVHRDLKPANVFLSADGTAKVGDFGLAVALDRSRLTLHGMMLGTVSYMPPEQALGGESTLKADLYSLGAMLYEMVTGRPPFLGDDPTAVISQHINTPPVAPSWVTEHCPPSLEEVILHLLEKDPGKRPASAAEVLAALEKVDSTQKSATHSDSNVLDRLARGVFVGREKELERLRKAFDEAFAGHGGLVMLVGEPGIGKTRTTQELETYARMRGATVLWGRTHESSGAPPYWPWLQVGNQFVQSFPELAGKLNLAPETLGELGRLFPFLKGQPNYVEPRENLSPESAQFRLFDAYATFLRAVATHSPVVVALDDLHWADKPTLQLLEHVAREVGRSRILIAANYRDTDITRQSALSETLATLNREPGFERVVLRGLTRDEVANYITEKAHVSPKREIVDRIFEETEGNAFFLSEVVNLMAEEGTLSKESVSDIAIPDGVKEAIGRRLNRLSADANELLQVATVVGREFAFETLALIGYADEERLLKLLEEALEARVIEELPQAGRYRFTHAQMQETLLAELSTTRRVRLHGQIGEALEKRYGERAREYAAQLARHYGESATLTPAHAAKAFRYGRLAGAASEAAFAWGDAAAWYERCLATAVDPGIVDSGLNAELLSRFGAAKSMAGDYRAAWRALMQARDAFRQLGDARGFATATLAANGILGPPARLREMLEEARVMLGDADAALEARLLVALLPRMASDPASREAYRTRARALGERYALADVNAGLLGREAVVALFAGRPGADKLLLAAADAQVEAGLYQSAVMLRFTLALRSLTTRPVEEGEQLMLAAFRFARHYRIDIYETNTAIRLSGVAAARADWAEFETLVSAGSNNFSFALQRAHRLELDGRIDEAIAALPSDEDGGRNPMFEVQVRSGRTRILYRAGQIEAARVEFAATMHWLEEARRVQSDDFARIVLYLLCEMDDVLVELADDDALAKVYTEGANPGLNWDPVHPRSLKRARAQVALHLGRTEAAEELFRESLEWTTRESLPIEIGRNLQGLADLAELRGDTDEAIDLLNRAAAIYQPRGVKLFLDQVVASKVRLQGITSEDMKSSIVMVNQAMQAERPDLRPAASPQGIVTLLFSDIENSTPLNNQMGDARWLELLRAHNAAIEQAVTDAGGTVVKTMGDGYMVAFSSARAGLHCAIAAQHALAASEKLSGIRVRMGLHTGEMLRDGADFFGRHVNLAARVASSGKGGEVVVSDVVHELVSGGDFTFSDGGEVAMKGFFEPMRVWHLQWDAPVSTVSKPAAQLRIDIDKEHQARRVAEVVESEYFQTLRSQTADLRSIADKS